MNTRRYLSPFQWNKANNLQRLQSLLFQCHSVNLILEWGVNINMNKKNQILGIDVLFCW
jgi:hypothetical protein